MDSAFNLLEWRSLLPTFLDVPEAGEQIRWAQLCFEAGAGACTRLLFETAFLRQGFSRQARADQAGIAKRTGLWEIFPAPIESSPSDSTIEIAIGDLRILSKSVSLRLSQALAAQRIPSASETLPHAAKFAHSASTGVTALDIDAAAHAFYLLLRRTDAPRDADARDALEKLWGAIRRAPAFDYRIFAAAPLPLLITAISFACLQEFLLLSHDLTFGMLGSAELFYRTAHLDSFGLGPYLSNVQNIARKSADIFELAYAAVQAGEEQGVGDIGIEPWMALLSRRLSGDLLYEVIDDLGDMGAMQALSLIYDRAASAPFQQIDMDIIMRLRDAAIDCRDYALASRAQGLVVRSRPDNLLELEILATIEGSAGRVVAAEQLFLECLTIDPDNVSVSERLLALKSHRFEVYKLKEGFGTPAPRKEFRHNRIAAATEPRLQDKRPLAVEL